jgi:hypothetical protein
MPDNVLRGLTDFTYERTSAPCTVMLCGLAMGCYAAFLAMNCCRLCAPPHAGIGASLERNVGVEEPLLPCRQRQQEASALSVRRKVHVHTEEDGREGRQESARTADR